MPLQCGSGAVMVAAAGVDATSLSGPAPAVCAPAPTSAAVAAEETVTPTAPTSVCPRPPLVETGVPSAQPQLRCPLCGATVSGEAVANWLAGVERDLVEQRTAVNAV